MNGRKIITVSTATTRLRVSATAAAFLLITASVVGMGASSAFALDPAAARTPVRGEAQQAAKSGAGVGLTLSSVYSPSSPITADPCLSLLDKVRQSSDPAVYRTRRPAGGQAVPAVAIGYVLGLRHAPGPKETLKDDITRNLSSSQLEKNHALAISSYRRCRSELELSLLQRKD